MVKSDQPVIITLAALLFLHTILWIVGYFSDRLSYLFSFLNAATAVMIIVFWSVHEFRIKQHFIEGRELTALGLELLVAAVSIFTILVHPASHSFKITQYIVFGIHFTVLVAGLIFMLTFKITKLF